MVQIAVHKRNVQVVVVQAQVCLVTKVLRRMRIPSKVYKCVTALESNGIPIANYSGQWSS